MKHDRTGQVVAGWREFVALPDWNIPRIRAKLDTGARTSAIHVDAVEELDDGRLRFEVVVREKPKRRTVWVEAEPVRQSVVKPSSGKRQSRHVVRTRLRIDDVESEVEVSLVSRKGMLCRMLIGRRALAAETVLVDSAHKYLLTSRKKAKGADK